jgi:hypothetical protein
MPAVLRRRVVALIVTFAVLALAIAFYSTGHHSSEAGTNWDNVTASTTWDD